MIIRSFVLTE